MPIRRIQDLFSPHRDEDRAVQDRVAEVLRDFLAESKTSSALPDGELERAFQATAVPEAPQAVSDYFSDLVDRYVPNASRNASPRSFAHMSSSVPYFMRHLSALIVGMNQNLVKADAARSLTLIERQTLAIMHRVVFGASDEFYRQHAQASESSLGIVSSGSTLANVLALWCARNAHLDHNSADGLNHGPSHDPGASRYVVIGSRLMHYSFAKAVDLLGLGERGLLTVPVDAAYRVDLLALRHEIDRCRRDGSKILAIVGVAGTTDVGSIDPLDALADICAEERIHFHVDAAWGGPLIFSDHHRARLAGIERADSVTFDGHKQLHLPTGIGMLLFRSPQLAKAIEKEAPYLIRPGSADLGRRALEGSRSGSVLFLHAALHIFGRQGYGALIDHGIALAESCAGLLAADPAFELLAGPELRIVVYRYLPTWMRDRARTEALGEADNRTLDALNRSLYAAQKAAGHSLVSMTTLPTAKHGGVVALRAVIANPSSTLDDFRQVLAHQAELGHSLEVSLR